VIGAPIDAVSALLEKRLRKELPDGVYKDLEVPEGEHCQQGCEDCSRCARREGGIVAEPEPQSRFGAAVQDIDEEGNKDDCQTDGVRDPGECIDSKYETGEEKAPSISVQGRRSEDDRTDNVKQNRQVVVMDDVDFKDEVEGTGHREGNQDERSFRKALVEGKRGGHRSDVDQ